MKFDGGELVYRVMDLLGISRNSQKHYLLIDLLIINQGWENEMAETIVEHLQRDGETKYS